MTGRATTTVQVLLLGDLDADSGNWTRLQAIAPEIESVDCAPLDLTGREWTPGQAKPVALVHRDAGYAAIEATAVSIAASDGGVIVVGDGSETVDDTLAALNAGAHGYIGTHQPVELLVTAIRAVAAGYLFAPAEHLSSITENLSALPSQDRRALEECTELTPREYDVLDDMARGNSNAEIGRHLFISESTVRTHVLAILRKFGARNRTEAVVMASQKGYLATVRPGTLPAGETGFLVEPGKPN